MGQWLRTPATVAENPGSVPISHMAATTTHNSVSGASHPLELELQVYISHVMWMLESEFQAPDTMDRCVSSTMVPYFCVLIDWICVCVLHTHIIYAYIHIYTIYIYIH